VTNPSADGDARPADAGRAPAPDQAPLTPEAQDPDTPEGAAVEAELAAAKAESAAAVAEHAATEAEAAFAEAQAPAAHAVTPAEAAFAGEQATATAASNGGQPLLRLVDLGKNFGPVRAMIGVDLDIPIGQVTAVVGDNGAGKSTLIKTISGIWQQDHGEIFWQGRQVRLHSPKDATDLGIATVYQDLALCDNLDIVQNMFLGREPTKFFQLDEVTMEKAAKRTLADLSVVTVRSIRQPVGSLSGGQRQAVAVAKAVLRQAKLVIMDEPTAALGVTQTRVVLDLIKRLKSQDIAVIVISHNLNDVQAVADRVAVMRLGRLVAVGPIAQFDSESIVDLMTTGTSKRLAAVPAEHS
jgi:ABC-type sugar transport system ATPase subunit